jgi:threonine dehydrogenase-like Zn-dependent dehydrogenase
MRIAVCHGPQNITVETQPIPGIDEEKVLVKVALCGICGSDLALWSGWERKYPYTPGHEISGVVEASGMRVTGIMAGQRVVINPNLGCGSCRYCKRGKPNLCDVLKSRPIKSNGGFSEFVALDYRMVHPLPEEITDEQATFIEPLSCALHSVRVADIRAGQSLAIFGGGILGILTGIVLSSMGHPFLFVEPLQDRRRRLEDLFPAPSLSPQQLDDHLGGRAFSTAIDCSGSSIAVSQAIELIEKGGTLVLAGIGPADTAGLPLAQVTKKELTLKGTWLNPDTFTEAITLIEQSSPLLARIDSITFSLADIERAFRCAAERKHGRVLVRP